jgi:hypothetical protein
MSQASPPPRVPAARHLGGFGGSVPALGALGVAVEELAHRLGDEVAHGAVVGVGEAFQFREVRFGQAGGDGRGFLLVARLLRRHVRDGTRWREQLSPVTLSTLFDIVHVHLLRCQATPVVPGV